MEGVECQRLEKEGNLPYPEASDIWIPFEQPSYCRLPFKVGQRICGFPRTWIGLFADAAAVAKEKHVDKLGVVGEIARGRFAGLP
jgi:hypothetical protein